MDPIIPIGAQAPNFVLSSLEGQSYSLDQQRGTIVVLNFWSAVCPWSKRADGLLLELIPQWGPGVQLWSLAVNADENPALMQAVAKERRLPLVLQDHGQQVADLYGAQATPHFFVIDAGGILRYQGSMDDAVFRKPTASRSYLAEALQALLSGGEPNPAQTAAYGCALVRHAL